MAGADQFPRGSEWRKWDLHIHTPASFHWNGGKRFAEMDERETEASVLGIAKQIDDADEAAFGVMDYWTFDGYLTIVDTLRRLSRPLSKTLFPGMELRVEAPVDFRLNVHVIFSEEITRQELIDFRSGLKVGGPSQRALSDDALRDLARGLDKAKAQSHGFGDGYQDVTVQSGGLREEFRR